MARPLPEGCQLVDKLIARAEHHSRQIDTTPNVVGGEAVAKCQEGDAAASIPVLERLLTNAGFTLPRHG